MGTNVRRTVLGLVYWLPKKELLDYVQELRALIAGTAADPLPEAGTLTVFMERLRTSAARTEVLRVHPTSFEEAVDLVGTLGAQARRAGRNRWTSAMLKTKKQRF
ncbi:hypothetical protein PC117_g8064 [Phytophthora cactorum]|uniref:Uncharacterized protein n=1 Tax=Phytophthora cactorum TaxID=29920 RepID=A0A8T1DW89_9STRA|nr:hypothetical protein PC117_g8064 [Phytophthora cactorum]